MNPSGPAGPVEKNHADNNLENDPSSFAVVTIRMVVPSKTWADHFASKYQQHAYLSDDALQVTAEIEDVHPSEWEMIRYEANTSAEQFDLGEWVEIDQIDRNGAREIDFRKGTIGQVIGIRWGWKTAFLVAVELPFVDKDGTEWLLSGEKPPYIAQYFSYHSLKRVDPDQIPEKYRSSARQRPSDPITELVPLSEEEFAVKKKILDDMITDIREEAKNYPRGSLYRWNAMQRLQKKQEWEAKNRQGNKEE